MTKHDGGYKRTGRSNLLGNNPDGEPGTDATNHRILKWRDQKAQSQGPGGLPRRTPQTTRMASPTHSVLQESRVAEWP